jgi:hypothetical protein
VSFDCFATLRITLIEIIDGNSGQNWLKFLMKINHRSPGWDLTFRLYHVMVSMVRGPARPQLQFGVVERPKIRGTDSFSESGLLRPDRVAFHSEKSSMCSLKVSSESDVSLSEAETLILH